MSYGFIDEPEMSDDGSKTVFTSSFDVVDGFNEDSTYEIFVADSSGAGVTQITSSGEHSGYSPSTRHGLAISGSGRYVAFGSNSDDLTVTNPLRRRTIFWVDLFNGNVGQPLQAGSVDGDNFFATWPRMTYDGSLIVFKSGVVYTDDVADPESSATKIYAIVRQ